jgi:tetratricopeptide (TPR) repeat protein
MKLRLWVFVLALAALVGAVPLTAADLTPDAAYTLVVRVAGARTPLPKPEELAAARRVLEPRAAKEPKSARWAYALAHVAYAEAEQAKDEAAKDKRKEVVERFERAAELQPEFAEGQVWLASACFDHVDDVGMLSQMPLASKGRKAFEKAIAIDPNHVWARIGLAQFLLQAPAIAGGSIDKAKEQGNALLAIPGKRGEYQGRMVLAGIASHEKQWDEMMRQLAAAETAQGDGADPLVPLRSEVSYVLVRKNDPKAAAPLVARYLKAAPPDDLSALFFDGELKRQLGQCAEALPRFEQVLAKYENARGSRWGAAVCREQLGKKAEARRDYEEFAKRFPEDDKAKDAKTAIKRLGS